MNSEQRDLLVEMCSPGRVMSSVHRDAVAAVLEENERLQSDLEALSLDRRSLVEFEGLLSASKRRSFWCMVLAGVGVVLSGVGFFGSLGLRLGWF